MLWKCLLLLELLSLFSCLYNFPRHILWDLLHWKKLGIPVGHLVLLADFPQEMQVRSYSWEQPVLTARLTECPDHSVPSRDPAIYTHQLCQAVAPLLASSRLLVWGVFNTFPICGPSESWDFLINFPHHPQQKKEEAS